MSFIHRFSNLLEEKNSVLCVGIDPALPRQRKSNTIPEKYVISDNDNITRLNFSLDIVDLVKDHALAIKPNQQYVFGFTKRDHQKLTDYARKKGMLSILDYKLNDISDTIESAIFHISESGYDAITFNPFPGNVKEATHLAHNLAKNLRGYELGVIVLTLMSNAEAVTFMKEARYGNHPVFELVSKQVKDYDADGCVVGCTGHVTMDDIYIIRKTIGSDKVMLIPGVGTQKGDYEKVLKAAGNRVLINVSRDIIYSENPRDKAREYHERFGHHRGD